MSSSMVLEHYTFLSAQQSLAWRYSISTSSLYIRSPPSGETFIYRYVTVLLSTRGTKLHGVGCAYWRPSLSWTSRRHTVTLSVSCRFRRIPSSACGNDQQLTFRENRKLEDLQYFTPRWDGILFASEFSVGFDGAFDITRVAMLWCGFSDCIQVGKTKS